jgi:hypothetical protein
MEAILCRTDLKIIRHGHRDLTLPRVPGEEVVGEVVPLGAIRRSPSATACTCTPGCGAGCARAVAAAPRTSAARCASWAFTATAARAALAKLEEWVAAQAGGLEQRTAGEARLAVLLGEAGLAG